MANRYGRALPLGNRQFPTLNKPRGLNFTFSLSGGQTTDSINVQLQTAGLEWITGIFVDNSANGSGVQITAYPTLMKFFVPAYSQALMPIIGMSNSDNVTFTAESNGGFDVPVIFTNWEGPGLVWSTVANGQIIGAVTVQGQVTTLPYNAGGSDAANLAIIAGGVSQQLFAINPTRKRLMISNPASGTSQGLGPVAPESLFIRFGAAASGAGVGGNFEIVPGGYFDTGFGATDTRVVNIVAATTGHVFAATQIN